MLQGDLVVVEVPEEPSADPVVALRAMAKKRGERARRARAIVGVIEVVLVTPDGREDRDSWPGVG